MSKVNLTGTLKTYKAIVILDGEELPKGYVVAAAFVFGDDTQIAIPEELMKNRELFNLLARQAQRCLLMAGNWA